MKRRHHGGFTLMYRDEEQDWLYFDKRYKWWLWLRSHATPKPCVVCVGDSRVEVRLKYGEVAATRTFLKTRWDGANERTINKFLALMEEDERITTREEKGILIIKIVDYEQYSPPPGYFAKLARENDNTANGSQAMPEEMSVPMSEEMPEQMQSPMNAPLPADVQAEVPTELPIIEINKKIENLNSLSSARNREFFESLKSSDLAIEEMLVSIKPPEGKNGLLAMLQEFLDYVIGRGESYENRQAFRQHFVNWAKYQLKQNSKNTRQNGKKENKGGAAGGAGSSRRSGREGSARSAEDYEKPFSAPSQGNDCE